MKKITNKNYNSFFNDIFQSRIENCEMIKKDDNLNIDCYDDNSYDLYYLEQDYDRFLNYCIENVKFEKCCEMCYSFLIAVIGEEMTDGETNLKLGRLLIKNKKMVKGMKSLFHCKNISVGIVRNYIDLPKDFGIEPDFIENVLEEIEENL